MGGKKEKHKAGLLLLLLLFVFCFFVCLFVGFGGNKVLGEETEEVKIRVNLKF